MCKSGLTWFCGFFFILIYFCYSFVVFLCAYALRHDLLSCLVLFVFVKHFGTLLRRMLKKVYCYYLYGGTRYGIQREYEIAELIHLFTFLFYFQQKWTTILSNFECCNYSWMQEWSFHWGHMDLRVLWGLFFWQVYIFSSITNFSNTLFRYYADI